MTIFAYKYVVYTSALAQWFYATVDAPNQYQADLQIKAQYPSAYKIVLTETKTKSN